MKQIPTGEGKTDPRYELPAVKRAVRAALVRHHIPVDDRAGKKRLGGAINVAMNAILEGESRAHAVREARMWAQMTPSERRQLRSQEQAEVAATIAKLPAKIVIESDGYIRLPHYFEEELA